MKTSRLSTPLAALIASAALLAACGNSQPKDPIVCPAIGAMFPIPPDMVYPRSGAAGVPDGNFPLVLSYNYGTTISLAIGSTIAVPSLAPTPVPSPLPSPAATPLPLASPVAFSVPQLQSGTTYTVSATFASSICYPESQSIGTFTTR